MKWPDLDKLVPNSFFTHLDTLSIAKQLIGKEIITQFDGKLCSVIITETEAYMAPEDKASHAYNNKKTKRTEVFYESGGCAYIYLCYGIHKLFNVITGPINIPHAVLIRGGISRNGEEIMKERLQKTATSPLILKGPGILAKAMGIELNHTGLIISDHKNPIMILKETVQIHKHQIKTSARIGVDSAGEWAQKEWRFYIEPSAILKQLAN